MKKTLLLTALLMVSTVFAFGQDKEIQLGGTVGTMYGLDLKVKKGNFAFIADLGVNLFSSPMRFSPSYSVGSFEINKGNVDAFTFEFNPNIAYQTELKTFSAVSLDLYAGGGISGGLIKGIAYHNEWVGRVNLSDEGESKDFIFGKIGVNAVVGIDINFNNVPLVLSFDFRPGYGMGIKRTETVDFDFDIDDYDPFEFDYSDFTTKNTTLIHFFDWKLVAGIRYRF